MWIENVSYSDIKHGNFPNPGNNSMLIQIVDPGMEFPVAPVPVFTKIEQFEFSDVSDPNDIIWDFRMSDRQAKRMAQVLIDARSNDMNVIVHCVAGISRSGAVVEVGLMMGFSGGTRTRIPNVHIKRELMGALGLTTNYDEIFK